MTQTFLLTICGLAELQDHQAGAFDHILSLLDPEQPDPVDVFDRYGPHHRHLLRFHDTVETPADRVPPDEAIIHAILNFGDRLLQHQAQKVLVYCHAGISRSTAASAILLAQHHPGTEQQAFAAVRAARPRSWPNSRMITLADAALNRNGALIAAMRQHHLIVEHTDPTLARLIRMVGRGHELHGDQAR